MITAHNFADSRLVRSAKTLFYWFALLSGLFIAVMAIHTALDVGLRNVANAPLPGTLNYVTYWWMPLLVFLVLAHAHMTDQHLTVTLASDGASGWPKRLAKIFSTVATLIVLASLSYFMVETAVDSWSRTETIVSDIRLEIWGIRFAAAFSVIAYAVASLLSLVEDFLRMRDEKHGADAHNSETGQIADV